MTPEMSAAERQLRDLCREKRVGLFISSRDWRQRRPHINLVLDGLTLATFESFEQAIAWLSAGVQQ